MRRSSNVVFSESRRFCSAALCEVLRRTGDGREDDVIELEVYIFPANQRKISTQLERVAKDKLPGNMGLRLGLTSVTPLPFLVWAKWEASFPRTTDFPLPSFFTACVGGASPLFMPSPPRFIMLAGVTGVICPAALPDDEIATGAFTEEDGPLISGWGRDAGGPGGGIDKSTGDGVSPGTSTLALFLCPPARDERSSGVEDADFVPRRTRFVEFEVDGTRGVGDGRRRATFACSSSGGDAVRLLRRAC